MSGELSDKLLDSEEGFSEEGFRESRSGSRTKL